MRRVRVSQRTMASTGRNKLNATATPVNAKRTSVFDGIRGSSAGSATAIRGVELISTPNFSRSMIKFACTCSMFRSCDWII